METMNKKAFFAFIHRIKYINRWGLMRNTRYENLKEHSYDVAVIAHGIAVIGNVYYGRNYNADRIAVSAMLHDVNEAITGDMPTPVKYGNKEIMKAYKELEKQAEGRILEMLPAELKDRYSVYINYSEEEKSIIKAADKISAYIKCMEEKKAGNDDFLSAEKTIRKAVDDIGLPEVKDFVRDFLPAYVITLDEIEK
jgi:5'-deoxynucleotidase